MDVSSAANPLPPAPPAETAESAVRSPGEIARQLRLIVHELNNPLAVMMGFTQLLLLDGRCEGSVRADLDRVYGEMKRVAATVERLDSFALSLQDRAGPPE